MLSGITILGADPEEPEVNRAAKGLAARVADIIAGRKLTESRLHAIERAVKDHGTQCRAKRIDFPAIAVLGFPQSGHLQMVRAEWDEKSIETNMINLAMAWPDVEPIEMARAIRRAFPGYRPSRCGFLPDLPRVILSDGTRWN